MWADEKMITQLNLWWRIGNALCIFFQLFCYFTVGLGIINHNKSISDFGEWLNVIAGASLAVIKLIFLIVNRSEVTAAIDCMAQLNEEIKSEAKNQVEIRQLRNSYFITECVLAFSSLIFTLLFELSVFLQGLFNQPMHLALPATTPMEFHNTRTGFCVTYSIHFIGSTWVACFMSAVDFMVGNIFNQLILNVEMLGHRIRALNRSGIGDRLTTVDPEKDLIRLIQDYQNLQEITHKLNRCFQPFLLASVLLNMVVVTFISIELAIVMNVDPTKALRPVMYLIFMNTTFFYWCWLGHRLDYLVSH